MVLSTIRNIQRGIRSQVVRPVLAVLTRGSRPSRVVMPIRHQSTQAQMQPSTAAETSGDIQNYRLIQGVQLNLFEEIRRVDAKVEANAREVRELGKELRDSTLSINRRIDKGLADISKEVRDGLAANSKEVRDSLAANSKEVRDSIAASNAKLDASNKEMRDGIAASNKEMRDGLAANSKEMRDEINSVRTSLEKKFDRSVAVFGVIVAVAGTVAVYRLRKNPRC